MGGKCVICGYNKCLDALDLHHINNSEKDFNLGVVTSNPISWPRIVAELKKCVLLCSNHHREIHKGLVQLAENYAIFNEEYSDYQIFKDLSGKCIICGKIIPSHRITCSKTCAVKRKNCVNWDKIDLISKINEGKSLETIAGELDIASVSVLKRLKNYHPEIYKTFKRDLSRKTCSICGTKITNSTKSGLCFPCYNLKRRKVERPTKEILQEEIKTNSWLALARKYGVTDNSIRKWAKAYQII